jgi:hypothetical protein
VGKVDIFITVSVTSRSIINSSSHKRVPLHISIFQYFHPLRLKIVLSYFDSWSGREYTSPQEK